MAISKRFFIPAKTFSVGQLADMLKDADLLCHNNQPLNIVAEKIITDIAGLDNDDEGGGGGGGGGFLVYAESPKYIQAALNMKNIGLLLTPSPPSPPSQPSPPSANIIEVKHAEYAFAILARAFYPHSHPIIADNKIKDYQIDGEGREIGVGTIIGKDVTIGKNVRIGSHSIIGDGCVIGDNCDIGNHCSIRASQIGESCRILSGTIIGERGFGFASFEGRPPLPLPHIGGVVIGDHVEIGANCTIDRGKLADTRLGHYVKLDNMVHIAHNVDIGDASMLAAQVAIAGSARVGREAMLGGQVAVAPAVVIGDKAIILPCSGVHADVAEGTRMLGTPAQEATDFARSWSAFKKLGNKRKTS